MEDLERFQSNYEQRFGCCICLGPKLNMVSGRCQHRICDECLYDKQNRRRLSMKNCPVCSYEDSFPLTRPIIPSQVVDIQRCLGVQECPNKCSLLLWYWEVEEHLECCPNSVSAPTSKKEKTPEMKRKRTRVSDIGPVSVTSRCPREHQKNYNAMLRPRKSSAPNMPT